MNVSTVLLLVSYFFYVLVLNWKAFVYVINTDLIPKGSLIVNNENITKLDFVQAQFKYSTLFIIPLLSAAVSIIILPLLNRLVSMYKTDQRIRQDNSNKKKEYGDLHRTTSDWQKLYNEKAELQKEYKESIDNYRDAENERNKFENHFISKSEEFELLKSQLADAENYKARFDELKNLFSLINKTSLRIIEHPDMANFGKNMPELSRLVSINIADIRNGANNLGFPNNI